MRADVYLFNTGMAKSRQNAKVLIESGNVIIDGAGISKPSHDINENEEHSVEIINKPRFVSRGGEKLQHALECFKIDPAGLVCLDIGASTGGFTDCLLQGGAGLVYAVDSGHSQLDPSIESDDRVISVEKYNAKFMEEDDFSYRIDLAVMDVSFISQTLIHQGINKVLAEDGALISLIKPQFECGKAALNSHGIVKKPAHHLLALNKVIDSALMNGFTCLDVIRSPIEGGSGNIEFLAYFRKSSSPINKVPESKLKALSQAK